MTQTAPVRRCEEDGSATIEPVASLDESRVTPSRTVLVIPGLGGHSVFHEHLISGLQDRFTVCTAPHLDFATQPCAEWDRHVRHWEGQLRRAAQDASAPPAVVGISFGAHVAHALRLRQPPESRQDISLTLVSYRHLTRLERRVLRGLSRAPRVSAYPVGTVLLRWSETQAQDRDSLLALRDELYDENRLVHARLAARLASLASAPPLRPAGDPATFVFGADERALRRRHARDGGTATVVPGGHSISIRRSPELLRTVERAICGDSSLRRDSGAGR